MKFVFFKEGGKGMTKKKKIVILSVMILLLIVTGYLNIKLNSTSTVASSEMVVTGNFFDTYKADRTSTRNQEIEYLDAIIENSNSTAEFKSSASNKKFELISKIETELILEGLIKAQGFEDTVVTVGSENINAIVKNPTSLTSSEVATILSIIIDQTGTLATNVKIIPVT